MANEALLLKIQADVKDGINGVKSFNAELAKSVVAQHKLSSSVGAMNKSFGTIKPGAAQAGNALMNLGRIAQDAPFGFVGISNNINPLLESFQRLRAESGSTGGALKALVGSLAGGAGLGLAVSIATGLLTVFGDKLFKSKQNTDELSESAKKYAEAQKSSAESLQKQLINVESLVKVATSDVSSKKEQAQAIEVLNKLIPENIGHLDEHNIKTAQGVGIIERYTKALTAQATAELLSGKAAELRVKQIEEDRSKTKDIVALLKKRGDAGKEIAKLSQQDQLGTGIAAAAVGQANIKGYEKAVDKNIDARLEVYKDRSKELQKEIVEIEKEITKAIRESISLEVPDTKAKTEKSITVQVPEIVLKPAKVGLFNGSRSLGVDAMAEISKDISTNITAAFVPLQTSVSTPAIDQANLKLTQLQNNAALAGTIVQSTLAPAFQNVFETIISGGGSALQAFGQAIKQLVAKIASAMITAAAFAAILNLIFPGSGLAAGGFSGAFKAIFSQLSGIPKFAKGGIATQATAGIFGEKGAEAIIPLKQLPGLMANMMPTNYGNGGNLSVTHSIQGQELLLLINRTQNQWGTSFR